MRIIKEIIKQLLHKNGYDLVRSGEKLDAPFDLLGMAIRDVLQRNADFFFVQIGANDGLMGDALYPIATQHHLKGLLVEPLPDQFEALRQNYAQEPQMLFENAAIAPEQGTAILYRFKANASLPDWTKGMASFDKQHLTKFKASSGWGKHIETVSVPTIPFSDLINKHHINHMNLLLIDTEGYDFEILKMAFKTTLLPEMIHFEHQHLNGKDYLACKALLIQHGYQYVRYGRDILAIRETTGTGAHS